MPLVPSPILALLPVIALAGALPASAATVGAGVNVILNGAVVSRQDRVDDTLSEGRVSAGATAGSGASQARAAGDVASGTQSVALTQISGDGSVGMSSDFTARGSGQVDFFFDTSARWSGAAANASFFEANLVAGDGFVSDFFDGDPGPAFQASGSLVHRLSYTATVADGASYYLAATVFAALSPEGPSSSAAIGGVLGYRASPGVTLAFDDPRFLAAPVPLPPGALLLAGGLFGLALLGWRAERGRGAAPAA